MRGMIEFIAHNLVDEPESVVVRTLREDHYASVLRLHVAESDLGKVIGRQGRVAQAMRTLMRASGSLQGKQQIGLEIGEQHPPTF